MMVVVVAAAGGGGGSGAGDKTVQFHVIGDFSPCQYLPKARGLQPAEASFRDKQK